MGRPKRTWNTPRVIARLGREPDGVIAADLNLSIHTIRSERVRRGIRMDLRAPRNDYFEFDEYLGLVPDAEVARLKGVTRQAVSARRAHLRIAACANLGELAALLFEVRNKGTEEGDHVSIPTDLYERICDRLTR